MDAGQGFRRAEPMATPAMRGAAASGNGPRGGGAGGGGGRR